ncbi:hypothetical protein LTR08_003582 [Meristemomyces frigidus]|nr:hypothetical protein LTR08_003582 [Meristemomyces frigidus]
MLKALPRLPALQATLRHSTPRSLSTTPSKPKDTAKPTDTPSPDDAALATKATDAAAKPGSTAAHTHKTQAQLDQELMDKMKGLSGDGGESGVEYENGVAVSMKRGVKDNMFRYI